MGMMLLTLVFLVAFADGFNHKQRDIPVMNAVSQNQTYEAVDFYKLHLA